mmetsp:Transcript_9534/g.15721  ORF Transcript_9534/g.15721 Transcript_9534/m.15721 type:complete len:138 (-) Transcript_9534:743-1156(-)
MWLVIGMTLICLVISTEVFSQVYYEDCPRGTYREAELSRECKPCAKGFYGETRGLTVSTCSAPCPKGRYSDAFGAKTIDDCKLCPPGVVGLSDGLSAATCSAPCPIGRYSLAFGATSMSACQACPYGYYGGQCYKKE